MKYYSIISHTHWDREWYLPFEQFRIRLVDAIDNLLLIMRNDENFRFHLDAQTIVLEDYLEIRPERRAELEKYIKEGRILVGPWYVQGDFHLTSGEATVRNLLHGTKIAEKFGGCMRVGYIADQFGICSQLPQLLQGFGIDSCIFGRGYRRDASQFLWEAENGSKVLCEHMFAWYNNLQRLPADPRAAYDFILERGALAGTKSSVDNYLLMNGVDHLEAQEDLTKILEGVSKIKNEDEVIVQDTLPEYVERLKNRVSDEGVKLSTYLGEMREGGRESTLPGSLSSRVYLKVANAKAQSTLEGIFEPEYAALYSLGIMDYPFGYSDYLWKTLIQNHPHDSICACSVDSVHRHMVDRYERLEENLTELNKRADEELMKHIDRSLVNSTDVFLMCSNNTLFPHKAPLTATVDILTEEDRGGFIIRDSRGRVIPYDILNVDKKISVRTLSPINLPGVKQVNRYTVILSPVEIAPLSKKVLTLTLTDGTSETTKNKRSKIRTLENEYLKVKINKNGTVDITNKKNGKVYKNALLIEDLSDVGDSYRAIKGEDSLTFTSEAVNADISVIYDTPQQTSVKISYKIKIDRYYSKGDIPITLTLTLRRKERFLRIKADITNNLKYHRTRIRIPTGIISDKNYASQPFDILLRDKISRFENDEIQPNSGLVGVDGEDSGVAVFNIGLYEYEHISKETEDIMAITLLRSTGRISGNHGIPNENGMIREWTTPEGQCIGNYSLDLAVYPYSGNHDSAHAIHYANHFTFAPYVAVSHVEYEKFTGGRPFVQSASIPEIFKRPMKHPEIVVPREYSFVKISDEASAMALSAFKAAENNDGLILRLYNTTSNKCDFSLSFSRRIKSLELVNLNEEFVSAIALKRGTANICAMPKEIITLKIKF